ncbi:MAG: Gfo/Idh/MocA family oxidoreductase [Candidatus Handelsmanbacteria bacterium]|nr:Gfo/Idh/MocA family oxidoreductase [Candidatus Handelsmanbacteria bacterium]
MPDRFRVAVIGCGRMGQEYLKAYTTYPDTQVVALVDPQPDRLKTVGERFGVKALFTNPDNLLNEMVPDVAAIVTPVKYLKYAVIACAQAGVRGISTEKPIAATLADADAMVEECRKRGAVFAGGNLQRAMNEVQEAARRLHAGEFGEVAGASVHAFGGEISGGGCQHLSVLRLFTQAEVEEVLAWGAPLETLAQDSDTGLIINGQFRLSNGLECQVFGSATPYRGVEVWTHQGALVRWDWGPPQLFSGYDPAGNRQPLDARYAPYPWSEFSYLTGSIRSFLAALRGEGEPWISGHDLRQALEVAIACQQSARRGNAPLPLPLEDRSLTFYPSPYRWLGGDATGLPQSEAQARGQK